VRAAVVAASVTLVALIFLGIAWELWLAPLRPGGSWLVLKVLPLLAPLRGILHGRRYTYQWSALLIWAYVAEGATRVVSDAGTGAILAAAEIALAIAFFGAAVFYLRSSRSS
jgi:uncharacterized membrane protein